MRKTGRPDIGGEGGLAPTEPETPPRLSFGGAWALLRTPSSESGVQTYYRALLGRAPDAEALNEVLEALRRGEITRVNVIAAIARSPEARARGLKGPGLLLIRGVNSIFERSGLGARVRRRRVAATAAADRALAARDARRANAGLGSDPAALARRVVVLEGMLVRLENRVFELQRDRVTSNELAAMEQRIAELEAAARAAVTG